MGWTRIIKHVRVLHAEPSVPTLPPSHDSEVLGVLLGSLADCEDSEVLLLLFPGVLLYLFPFLEVVLQLLFEENLRKCHQ